MVPLLLCGTISCFSPYQSHFKNAAEALSKDNYDEAISEFTKAIEINPNNPEGYSWRGSCYYYKAQYDLAINDFNSSINLKDKSINEDYNLRGLSYYSKGDYSSAVSDFTKAIEIYNNPIYYINRGLAYYKTRSYDLSIQDYTLAIKKDSKDPRPYSYRADAYIVSGQTSLAIEDLKNTLVLAKNDPDILQSARDRLKSLGVTE